MNNFLGQINAKHGIFRFSLNDEYIGSALNEYGEFSEIEFSIMNKFIEKDDVVFDIGSNIGAFTIPFAKNALEALASRHDAYALSNFHQAFCTEIRQAERLFLDFVSIFARFLCKLHSQTRPE